MKLDDGDCVVGCDVVTEGRQVFFISEQGIGKRTNYSEFTQHHRAGYGVRAMKLSDKTGKLVGAWGVADDQEIVVISRKGRMVRINTNEISSLSRTATGYKVVRLDDGDFVADVSIVKTDDEGRTRLKLARDGLPIDIRTGVHGDRRRAHIPMDIRHTCLSHDAGYMVLP